MRRPTLHQDETLEVKMTPMIDVVFLLLVFFVWTSTFELPEFDLPSPIAQTSPSGNQANADVQPPTEVFDEIVVKVLHQDGITILQLNGQSVADLATLRQRLTDIIALGVQPPVIVDPAPQISMGEAVGVYDIAMLAGADRVLFAAKAE
ncbi:biopolymer transporter ExbD [Stieleria varia]|uniref:Biopolymer transport protein ExbD/TolR n=1 Tax=Stieleria varia TaxID=2528005 RepID=A0A5C6B5P3_9BACT|nr:biopolymer transporter ExbD [Stieleria varia]TWU07605.1 Biopolymer transport protein ExbD/TolR [Stieleria varia]